MQIVFINYFSYELASGVHIHFIANELTRLGHQCMVVLPFVDNTDTFGEPLYAFSSYEDFARDLANGRYGEDTILHAWTPRENVRLVTLLAARTLNIPYFVHLEDNERRILESYYGEPFNELVKKSARGAIEVNENLSHPVLHQAFLAEAAGVSVLMDRLDEFVPATVPTRLIWPACEKEFFRLPPEPDMTLRRRLGIPDEASVIVYPGNVHHAVADTVAKLYEALPLVEAAGHPIRLVRCAGSDNVVPARIVEIGRKYVISLSNLPPRKLPEFMAMSSILVQPGSPDAFDEYRFPSKLPLFLASGRPVVLASTNIGRFLTDGDNCLILEENTPEAIAGKIIWLLEHPAEARNIGRNGRKFAAENFSWPRTAQTLLDFYTSCRRDAPSTLTPQGSRVPAGALLKRA